MSQGDNFSPTIPAQDGARTASAGPVLDIKRLIWLRGPVVLLIWLCVGIPAAIAVWFLVPVGYTASVEVRFLATAPRVLYTDADPSKATPYEKFLNTQISLLTGNTVLLRVLDSAKIHGIPALAATRDPLDYLKRRVNAHVERTSEIVTITCSMPDKDAAERVLQEIVTVYMDYAMTEEASAGSDRLASLTKERDARQVELEAQLKTIGDLQGSLGVPIVGQTPLETGEAQLYNESLARAEEDLAKAQDTRSDYEAHLARIESFIKSATKGSPIYDLGVEDRVNSDARVTALRQEVVKLQASLASMTEVRQENSPQLKVEQKQMANLNNSLAGLEFEVRKEALQSMRVQQVQNVDASAKAVEEAQQRVNKFRKLVDDYRERMKSATDQFAKLEELKSKAAETHGVVEKIRESISEITLESNAPARIKLMSPVSVPGGGPDLKPRFIMMILAFLGSLGLGVGVGFLLELSDQQVRSPQDLVRMTKFPVIATIPHAKEDSLRNLEKASLLSEERSLSVMSDEYRRVLARLLYPSLDQGEVRSLVVVSSTRGDGKSSLTTNLGVALARSGRRVLMVDVSYRRPTLEKLFQLPQDVGLAEVLSETVPLDHAMRSAGVNGLFLLGPGLEPGRLAESLASRDMARFLNDTAEQFDYVIIDTPPWLIMSEAKLITPLIDGVLFVVGSGVSTLGMVKRCLRELTDVQANVLGIVLNGVRYTPGGYMSKNRDLYYAYGHETK